VTHDISSSTELCGAIVKCAIMLRHCALLPKKVRLLVGEIRQVPASQPWEVQEVVLSWHADTMAIFHVHRICAGTENVWCLELEMPVRVVQAIQSRGVCASSMHCHGIKSKIRFQKRVPKERSRGFGRHRCRACYQ
jgi:hypothetical protein